MSINTFFGLQIGREALQAQQRALEVTGHNIANANTEGYTRQQAVFSATNPYAMPSYNKPLVAGQVGTGVYIQEIRRLRDDFIDGQMRKENTSTAEWGAKNDTINKLEVIINEPSNSGLRSVFEKFWGALQDLSKNPESGSVRALVRQNGVTLAEAFNHIDKQLIDLNADINSTIKIKVGEINNIATQIRDLNDQIVKVEVSGDHANDLRDKRDVLVDQLSKIVDVQVTEPADQYGAITITVGGRALVLDQTVNQMAAVADVNGNYYLNWSDNNTQVNLNGGLIKGMIDSRDDIVADYQSQIDTLAGDFITAFNNQHMAGYGLDGINNRTFFTGSNAADIAINMDNVTGVGNLNNLAASITAAGVPGDGTNATTLADLKDQAVIGAPASTFDDYYRSVAAQLGVEGQAAQRMVDNQNLLITELDSRKQSISGVSLDEEMTNMIKFQHAYSAAARLVTTMDEMLDTIINKVGLVGR